MIAVYYSMIAALDANVGRLLDHLEARGLASRTLVVFLSDNGWLSGEHRLVTKGAAFYEELVRTPFVLRWPGAVPAGAVLPALVSSLDLLPTLVRLAGAAPPEGLAGQDLWPLLDGAGAPGRALFLEYLEKVAPVEVEPMLGLVTERFKYARYLRGGDEELYDLAADPDEMRNLARSPDHAGTLAEQRARVDAFRASIAKPFWELPQAP
jgi:uncharacterized sulfatase